jgi:hypothetical protein
MEEFAFDECCRCTRTMRICVCVPGVFVCTSCVRVCICVYILCVREEIVCAREEQQHRGRDPALEFARLGPWDPNVPTFEAAHKHISVLKVC